VEGVKHMKNQSEGEEQYHLLVEAVHKQEEVVRQ
jgi:hypothetical protein